MHLLLILLTGRIVNLSSELSRFSLPNRSTYGITKYGIQALSDCLRFEVKRWGISVSIIEPGSLVSGKEKHLNVSKILLYIF
jgi:3-hydroxybutyrate dehydrogenase